MTDTHHPDTESKLPTPEEIFGEFMRDVGNIPITMVSTVGGGKFGNKQPEYTITTLSKAPEPLVQLVDTLLRKAFGEPPLSQAGILTQAHLLRHAQQQIQFCMDALKPDHHFTNDEARTLRQHLIKDFSAPNGTCLKELKLLSGFFADIYEPIHLGLVSYSHDDISVTKVPAAEEGEHEYLFHYADEIPDEVLEAESALNAEADLAEDDETPARLESKSFYDLVAESPLTLHPYVETKRRLESLTKRLDKEAFAVFEGQPDTVASQKLAILHQLRDTLISDTKALMLGDSDALYQQQLDLSPRARAEIFFKAITLAAAPDTTVEQLRAELAPGSDLLRHFYRTAFEQAPANDLDPMPATHIQTTAGLKSSRLDDPTIIMRQ